MGAVVRVDPRHRVCRNRIRAAACGRVATHPGTVTDSPLVLASPLSYVAIGHSLPSILPGLAESVAANQFAIFGCHAGTASVDIPDIRNLQESRCDAATAP